MPNYSSRALQLRLLLLVFSLGLVVVMMGEVRKPQRWAWLWQFEGTSPPSAGSAMSSPARTGNPPTVRTRGTNRIWTPATRIDTADQTTPVASHTGYFPGVDPRRLEPIEDHSLFRRRERDAWFHLLEVLRKHSSDQLREASSGAIGFAQLYHQPDYYRGRLVTLRGQVRRTEFVDAPANPSGVEGYHRLTMHLAGGPSRPVVVFSLALPEGFPRGNDLRESIAVTGFFFKNCAYPTPDDVYSFPTLLAKNVERNAGVSDGASTLGGGADAGPRAASVERDSPVANADAAPATPDHAAPDDSRDRLASLLKLVGVGPDQRQRMARNDWLDSDTLPHVLETLFHVRRFERHEPGPWVDEQFVPEDVADASAGWPVRLYAIEGRLQSVQTHTVPGDLAARLQISEVHACQVRLGASSWPAEILALDVPQSLQRNDELDEHVAATGLLVRVEPVADQRPRLVFAAGRLKWHPDRVNHELGVSHGMTVLGALRMDVGLWDTVRDRRPLEAGDGPCFYQLMDAAQRAGNGRLERAFQRRLPAHIEQWKREAARLTTRLERQPGTASAHDRSDADRHQLTVLRERIALAERGISSVVPLFNQPKASRGSLVVLEGTARRAVRIYGHPSPTPHTPGSGSSSEADAYYELDVFTEDSQHNPVVICVRRIPPGFPVGDQVQERVRVAGFMFKAWAYAAEAGNGLAAESSRRWRVAPLVVAPAATWIRTDSVAAPPTWQWWGGGLFVLALVAAWAGLAYYRRGDRRFQRDVLERQLRPDGGMELVPHAFSEETPDTNGAPGELPEWEPPGPE